MATVNRERLMSISDARKIGIAALVRDVENGHDRVFLRNGKPVAAMVSIERLEEWEDLEADLIDISLLAARSLTTGGNTVSLDHVLNRFGFSREQLRTRDDE